MKPVPKLTLNEELTKIAQNEVKKFCLNQDYKYYQVGNELKNIIPDYYLTENPALLADLGSDDPNNQIVKLLLNKIDKKKKEEVLLQILFILKLVLVYKFLKKKIILF